MVIQPVMAAARQIGSVFRLPETSVESPNVSVADALKGRREALFQLDAWADGRVYDEADWSGWKQYKVAHKLPEWIKTSYNPVQRVIDWYAGHLYRGTWTEDGRPLPDGTPNLIPVPADVWAARPDAVTAAFQALTWSNFRSVLFALTARTCLLGNQFVEIVADVDGPPASRKVKAQIVPLSQLVDFDLNAGGDVKRYVLAYATTINGKQVNYRKEVDGETVRIFHDDRLVQLIRHPYGFCPGVWFSARLRGSSVFGTSLVAGVLGKLDRINALSAHTEANISRRLNMPLLLLGEDGQLTMVQAGADKAAPADGATVPSAIRTIATQRVTENGIRFAVWNAKGGGAVPMIGDVDLGGVNDRIAALIGEVESDLPEIVFDEQLRQMSQVTGPGAEGMIGDVRARYDEVQGNLDAGIVKLMQMTVTIGAIHCHAGDWDDERGNLTRQQALFRLFETRAIETVDRTDPAHPVTSVTWEVTGEPIGPESFARGTLALSIVKRHLIEDVPPAPGSEEYERTRQMRLNTVSGYAGLDRTQLELMGDLSASQITALLAEQMARDDLSLLKFNAGTVTP